MDDIKLTPITPQEWVAYYSDCMREAHYAAVRAKGRADDDASLAAMCRLARYSRVRAAWRLIGR